MKKIRLSLILKMVLTIFLLQGLVLTSLGFFMVRHFDAQIDARVTSHLKLPALLMNQESLNYDTVKDLAKLENILGERVLMAMVVTRSGMILHASDPKLEGRSAAEALESSFVQHISQRKLDSLDGHGTNKTHAYLEVLSPVHVDDTLVGYLYIKADTSLSEAEKRNLIGNYIFSTVIGVIFTSVGSAGLLYLLITPRLRRTLACLANIGAGNLGARIQGKASTDELGELQEGINSMARELQNREQLRLEADAKLCESQQELDAFFLDSPAGLAIVDDQLRYTKINRTLAEFNGTTVAEHLGRTASEIIPELAPIIEPMFRQVIEEGVSFLNIEVNGESPSDPGVPGQWMVSYFPMKRVDGRVGAIGVVVIETTERHQAEEALRESEHYMAEAQRIASIGSFDGDLCNDELNWSKELYRIHFKDPMTFNPTKQTFVELLHPDDRDSYLNELEQSLTTGSPLDADYRTVAPDGSLRTLHTTAYVKRDKSGMIFGLQGVVQDITERKQDQDDLVASEQRFRSYFQLGLIGIAITSPEKGWIQVNDQLCRIFGYPEEELTRLTWAELTHPDDLEKDVAYFNQVLSGEIEGYSMEKRFIRKNGDIIHASISVKCFRNEDQSVDYFLAFVQDITERRQAEQALRHSEALLSKAQEIAQIGSFEWNATKDVIVWSDEMYNIYGISREDFGGSIEDVMPLTHPDDRILIQEGIEQGLTEGTKNGFEYRIIRPDGTIRTVFARAEIKNVEDENSTILIGFVQDITEKKQSEDSYSNLLNSLNAGVIVHAPDTSILIANPAASRILGLSEDQMLGKQAIDPQWKFLREDKSDMPLDEYPVHQIQRTREPMRNQVVGVNRPKTGDIAWVLVSGFPVFQESGQIKQVVINFIDFTDRKEAEVEKEKLEAELLEHQRRETELAEAKLDELRQQLVRQTRLATIGQMTASIAHEIRNPLGAVRNAAFLLKRKNSTANPKQIQYLDIIDKEVDQVDRVIRDMLEMARSKEPTRSQFDLSLLVQETFDRAKDNASVQFDLTCDPNPFFINADQNQMRQVIGNLFLNSIQAMKSEGKLQVDLQQSDNHYQITVQDNGPGVMEEYREQLFEPLITSKSKGTGLGLTICQQIIERHGGTIELQEDLGRGASIIIQLPQS